VNLQIGQKRASGRRRTDPCGSGRGLNLRIKETRNSQVAPQEEYVAQRAPYEDSSASD